jgi:hypothetical protein
LGVGVFALLELMAAGEVIAAAAADALAEGALEAVGEVAAEGAAEAMAEGATEAAAEGAAEAAAEGATEVPGAGAAKPGAAQQLPSSFPDFNPTGNMTNCGACADAFEDAVAGNGFNPAPPGSAAWPTSPGTAPWDFSQSASGIENALQTSGNGARGIVYVEDATDAHVFNALNQGGQILAVDVQVGVQGTIVDVAASAGYSSPTTIWGWLATFP